MSKVKVNERNSFKTVIAETKIVKGETIIPLKGNKASTPDKYSLQISETEHLSPYSSDTSDPLSVWRFLNHSCSANSHIDLQKMALIALSDILPGEEVRFNYNTTELKIAAPFLCECNSGNCYGEIKGFGYLPKEEQKKLASYLAPHLKKIIELP
jgi:SET domain-containing protein